MEFKDKTVLVTGSARHTGYAVAESFLKAGATVIVNSEDEEDVAAAVARLTSDYGDRVVAGAADIADEQAVDRLFERVRQRCGRLDILVNNACLQAIGFDFIDGSYREWKRVIDVNLNGLYLVSQRSAGLMKEQGGGVIVNIGSNAATHALRSRSPYGASKGAVEALTKAMALDLAEYRIRVNAVIPGYVRTARWDAVSDEEAERRRANIPLGQETLYEDVAAAILFLAGGSAKNITGTRLVVDGGSSAQLVPKRDEARMVRDRG